MRTLSIQVQPDRVPTLDIDRLRAMMDAIALDGELVANHTFDSGIDNGPYLNFTFGTFGANKLWERIIEGPFRDPSLGLEAASIVDCSSESGWDDYLLLFHYDPTIAVDRLSEDE